MKLLFLCGSLEEGRDGVGDYTRLFAGELIKNGHDIKIIAINDQALNDVFIGNQFVNGVDIPVLRLPAIMPRKIRFRYADECIKKFDPDWLSLQFVIFSFHPKGLPFGLNKWLEKLGKGRKWHIMFHELWVGMSTDASRKLVLWGKIQRFLIHSLIKILHPDIINTQTFLYQKQLNKIGVKAEYLPLFSNIPVASSGSMCGATTDTNKKDVNIVIFGSIYPHAPVESFAKEISSFARESSTEVSITMVGHCGKEEERWVNILQSEGLNTKRLGVLPPKLVSEVLKCATIGLSTTPIALVEKSGSAAAMREHGLPILCLSKPWKAKAMKLPHYALINADLSDRVFEYNMENFKKCIQLTNDYQSRLGVSEIASLLVDRLSIKNNSVR